MTTFSEVKERNLARLSQYVPIVARVHGGSHPEFHTVHRLFNELTAKIKEAGSERPDLHGEFKELRQVTGNYAVPCQVCESYEAVYSMLAELDAAYGD